MPRRPKATPPAALRRATARPCHPHIRLVPPLPFWYHQDGYAGMDCQEVWNVKCDERAAWLVSLGLDPDTTTVADLIRRVK